MKYPLIFVCVGVLLLGGTTPLMAESVKMKDNPRCKNWHSMIGEWTVEVEYRASPEASWNKGTARVRTSWDLDGSIVKNEGQNYMGETFVELNGFDPRLQTHFFYGFASNGDRWIGDSADWDGNTITGNWTAITADGKTFPGTCTFEYNLTFTSATAECRRFTDGRWWTDRKMKRTKVK